MQGTPGARDAHHHRKQTRKAAVSGWICPVLEYYDFFIYATASALIFPQLFFPSGNPKTAIAASLATYGVGYVALAARLQRQRRFAPAMFTLTSV